MTVAERVKEFFHNEGIHSTTIQVSLDDCGNIVDNWFQFKLSDFQPEFVEAAEPTGSISSAEDCMLACPKPKTTDQVKGLYAYILVRMCVLSMTILDLCQMRIPCPYGRIWPSIDDWLTGLLLQGCDASKCCPPSFAKNGNGQLPFNRWRLLVDMFNCLTLFVPAYFDVSGTGGGTLCPP